MKKRQAKAAKYISEISEFNSLIQDNPHIVLDTSKAIPNSPQRQKLFSDMERLIRRNFNITSAIVNYFEPAGRASFLMYFAQENCHEMVDLLLQLGAPVDTADQTKACVSALMRASEYADTLMVQKLLNKKSNPRIFNELGFAPIHLAMGRNLIDMVKVLLGSDKDLVNFRAENGIPLLSGAILQTKSATLQDNEKMIVFLLENGADVSAEFIPPSSLTNRPWNAFYAAIQQGFPSIIRLIHENLQGKSPKFVANIDLITNIMSVAYGDSLEKLQNIKALLCELGYLQPETVVEENDPEINGINAIIRKVNTGEINTFSSLQTVLDNNTPMQVYLAAHNDENVFYELIKKIRAEINESMTIKELLPLTKMIRFHLAVTENSNLNSSLLLQKEYITIVRMAHDRPSARSFDVISLSELKSHLKILKYCQKLCIDVSDIDVKNLLFYRMFHFLKIGYHLLPDYAAQWLSDYLDNKNNPYQSFPEYQFSVTFLLTAHIKYSADSPVEKSKYVEAQVAILKNISPHHVTHEKTQNMLNYSTGICLIMKSLISKEVFHIARADKFCTDHDKEFQFLDLNEWADFQTLVKNMHEKPQSEKQPARKLSILPPPIDNATVSQQSETTSDLSPTEEIKIAVVEQVSEIQISASHTADEPLQKVDKVPDHDGEPGSSSGKTASQNQHTSTLPSYKTSKPQRRQEQAVIANNVIQSDEEKILTLFGLPADMQENIICIDKKRNRWACFELTAKNFSDPIPHEHFLGEFKKGDPHFVKSKDLDQWVVTLAPGGMDERVFATEEVEKDAKGRSWRLLRFNRIGDHDDYNKAFGNLHYKKPTLFTK